MYQKLIKIFEIAAGELPGVDREVVAWGKYSGPRVMQYHHNLKKFCDGFTILSPEYWCYPEQFEKTD